jgi:Outer membrane protein beta-barrel domain
MIKKTLAAVSIACVCSTANADMTAYLAGDIGIVKTDHDNDLTFSVGGGFMFNEHVEIELAYNDLGESGSIDITSYSAGINLGAPVSETTRVYGILGAERLEADGSFNTGYGSLSFDDSSTEFFFGVGATFRIDEHVAVRTRLVGHDSSDIITATVGIGYYF